MKRFLPFLLALTLTGCFANTSHGAFNLYGTCNHGCYFTAWTEDWTHQQRTWNWLFINGKLTLMYIEARAY